VWEESFTDSASTVCAGCVKLWVVARAIADRVTGGVGVVGDYM
jgi:hypothetical protein